jgi:hypothetical protein
MGALAFVRSMHADELLEGPGDEAAAVVQEDDIASPRKQLRSAPSSPTDLTSASTMHPLKESAGASSSRSMSRATSETTLSVTVAADSRASSRSKFDRLSTISSSESESDLSVGVSIDRSLFQTPQTKEVPSPSVAASAVTAFRRKQPKVRTTAPTRGSLGGAEVPSALELSKQPMSSWLHYLHSDNDDEIMSAVQAIHILSSYSQLLDAIASVGALTCVATLASTGSPDIRSVAVMTLQTFCSYRKSELNSLE